MTAATDTLKRQRWVRPSVLPGFGLTLGYSLVYLSIIVLLPLAALLLRPAELGLDGFWKAVTAPRVIASLKLSFGACGTSSSSRFRLKRNGRRSGNSAYRHKSRPKVSISPFSRGNLLCRVATFVLSC